MFKRIEDINELPLPRKFKTTFLLKHIPNSRLLVKPPAIWQEGLVCIIKNRQFEDACYIANQQQFDLLLLDSRPHKDWMLIPDAKLYAY